MKKNKELTVQAVFLWILAGVLIYLQSSRKIYLYLHPKFVKLNWIAVLLLILFGSGLFFYAGKYKRLKKIGGWYLIIPLMMALTFPRMQPAGQQGGLVFSPTKTGTLEPLPKLPNGHVATVDVTELGPVQVRREDGRYMAEDDVLGRFLGEVYKNPVDFDGEKVRFIGHIVPSDAKLSSGQIQIQRQLIYCCVVDMIDINMVGTYRGEIPSDWVLVDAVIHEGKNPLDEKETFRLEIEKLEKINPPEPEFLYYI